jgi:general secretion pathway protein D
MPFDSRPHLTPVFRTCSKALSLLVFIAALSTYAADSVVQLAEREAMKRQMRIDSTGAELKRASDLVMQGKTDEALTLLESLYEALPEAPLTREARSVTKAGYLSVGCMRCEELMAAGKRLEADALLEKLLKVSPNDQQVLDLQKRFADPDRFPPALTAEHIENVRNVQGGLLKANSAVEIGDYDLAIRLYQDVIRIDSANSAARRGMERAEREKERYFNAAHDHQRSKMLNAVTKAWEEPVPPSSAELSALFGARVQASAGKSGGREGIVDKLRNYRMPKVEFQQATIVEILELLRLRSRDLDPLGKGVDFVLNVPDDSRQRQITLSLSDVPLEEVLRYVCEAASVTYRIEEHAVMVSSLSEKNATLVTRSFRVPPDFIQNSPVADAAPPGGDPFQPAAPASGGLTLRRMGAKEFLESRGIPFPDGASASFSGGTSTLVVRNTATNMEMVENLVDLAAKNSPKMVVVSVRMLEVAQKNLDELGFDWLMGGVGFNGNNVFAGGGTPGAGIPFAPESYPFGNSAVIPPVTLGGAVVFPSQSVASATGGPPPIGVNPVNGGGGGPITAGNRSGGFATGQNALTSLLETGSATSAQSVAPGILSVAGVFTDPQFQTVLRGLAQKKGVDIAVSPSVTTKSGVKATVEIAREFIYPTEFDPPQLPQGNLIGVTPIATPTTPTAFEMRKTGVTLEVEPVVSDDARTVEILLSPEIVDFEGFVNYGSPINSPNSSAFRQITVGGATAFIPLVSPEQLITPNKILQPVFKSSKVSTAVKVWDGQTVVLGGLKQQEHTIVDDQVPILGDLPFVGRLFRTHVKRTDTKNIIIFVTVNVIDPSGQKINRDTASVGQ